MTKARNSSNSSPTTKGLTRSPWTDWELGLLLLALDWFTARGRVEGTWTESDDGDSIVKRFNEWRMFLRDPSYGLRPIGHRTHTSSVDSLRTQWYQLKVTDDLWVKAVNTVQSQLLPLREKLQDKFGIKICYIQNDKLPGDIFPSENREQHIMEQNSDSPSTEPAQYDSYPITFSRSPSREDIQILHVFAKAERKKRETAYDAMFPQPENEKRPQNKDDEGLPQTEDDDGSLQTENNEGSLQIEDGENLPQSENDEGSPQTEDDERLSQIIFDTMFPQSEHDEESIQTEDDEEPPHTKNDEESPQTLDGKMFPQIEDDEEISQILQDKKSPKIVDNEEQPQNDYDLALQKNLAMMY